MWKLGVIHHDIKPTNIMVRRNLNGTFQNYYDFYLIDFGFSRGMNQSLLGVGTLFYSVRFQETSLFSFFYHSNYSIYRARKALMR